MEKGYLLGIKSRAEITPELARDVWRITTLVGEARKQLNPDPIISCLAEEAIYESQDVLTPLAGKTKIATYLQDRFSFIRQAVATGRDGGEIEYGTVHTVRYANYPCIVFSFAKKRKALWIVSINGENKIERLDITTIAPHPDTSELCTPPMNTNH